VDAEFFSSLERHFDRTLDEHGATARGVDWKSAESQTLRFDQLLTVHRGDAPFSIIDYGCGYGALASHMMSRGLTFSYTGFDVNERMLRLAREHVPSGSRLVADRRSVGTADYTVASGLFNLRLTTSEDEWLDYVLTTLESIDEASRVGFAFNMLTIYSDRERMRPDLYYADPCFFFDYCKRHFSSEIALLHDYGLFEFTVIVRRSTTLNGGLRTG
jgi:SAM-dependent methyltransferase